MNLGSRGKRVRGLLKIVVSTILGLSLAGCCGLCSDNRANDGAYELRLDGHWDALEGIEPNRNGHGHSADGHTHIPAGSKFDLVKCKKGQWCDYRITTMGFLPDLEDHWVRKIGKDDVDEFLQIMGVEELSCHRACIATVFYDMDELAHILVLDKRNPRSDDGGDCPRGKSLCAAVVTIPICNADVTEDCVPFLRGDLSSLLKGKGNLKNFLRDPSIRLEQKHFGHSHSGGEP